MIEDALSYPLEGDEAARNLLIGSALVFLAGIVNLLGLLLAALLVGFLFFPVAFVLGLPVTGYLIAVLRTTVQGYDQPPQFQDWGTLFADGLKATVVLVVYSLVPSILLFGLGFVFLGLGSSIGNTGGGIVGGLGLLFVLLLVPVYLVVGYVTPAALTNFAVHDDVAAAFDFGTILAVITDGDYLVAAVVAVVVGGVAAFVATLLYAVLVGLLVSPFIYVYVSVATCRTFGTAYRNATSDDSGRSHARQGRGY